MLTDKVRNTILNNDLIKRGTHIVIGLSGGPDSVCLFHVLCQLKFEFDIKLYAVHINHGLRPGAAEQDQNYVEKLCETYHVPCECFSFDVLKLAKEWKMTSEEAGRKLRYESFYQVAAKISGRKKIAVAQNLNDQAETLLMRIMRGTGTDGLAGIDYERNGLGDIPIIRPLLDVTREEIEAYCEDQQLAPCIDATNLEPVYTRNKIRLQLLPYLAAQFNPNILEALNRLSHIAKQDKEYLYRQAEQMVAPYRQRQQENGQELSNKQFKIPISALENLHPAVLNRVIMIILKDIGLNHDLSAVHLSSAVQLICSGKTSVETDFPGGYGMRISYGNAVFLKRDRANDEKLGISSLELLSQDHLDQLNQQQLKKKVRPLKESIVSYRMPAASSQAKQTTHAKQTTQTAQFDYDEMKKNGCEPILRYRKKGDWIRPQGMTGTKKLQNYFVDAKIERELRDRIPLVCLGSEVIWIIGYRISENYRVRESTENILLLEYCEKL